LRVSGLNIFIQFANIRSRAHRLSLSRSIRIKNLLGIVGDKYGAGVGENDLFIIATARSVRGRLISNEGFQAVTPLAMHKYKIPTVCAMKAVKVTCVNFVEFIKHSKVVFG
jgi:hypothetical protein